MNQILISSLTLILLYLNLIASNNHIEVFSNITDRCDRYRMDFSRMSSDFIWCVDNNTVRPLSICRHCKDQYLRVQKSFEDWKKEECQIDLGIDLDPVHETYNFIGKARKMHLTSEGDKESVGLWEQGFCCSCYTHPFTENSSLTEKVQVFSSLFQDVQDCFSNYENISSKDTHGKKICSKCRVNYNNLVQYYTDTILDSKFNFDGICFDIVDSMNYTQNLWGKKFQCGRQWKINAGKYFTHYRNVRYDMTS